MGDVGDHLRHQPGLGPDADPFGRPSDRLLELVGRERRNRLGPFGEQLPEAGVEERAVVEVRPEGHDHAQPALGVGGGHAKRLEEQLPLPLVCGEREDLLELVDHEHDLRLAGRDEIHGLEQAPRSGIEQVAQPGHRTHRDPKERGLELLDGVRSGEHLGDESDPPGPPGPRAGSPERAPRGPPRTSRPRSGRRRPGTWIRARPRSAW